MNMNITPEIRRRAVSAFLYFNPYALLDGERCNPWSDLRQSYERERQRFAGNTRHGFLHWLIAEAAESEYCRIHDC